jgi:predicted ATPase
MSGVDAQGGRDSVAPSFVGRQAELEELAQLLSYGQRLVTVVAPGGYGKTRLINELCERLRGHYRHGVAVVMLAAVRDAGRLASVTAEAVGLSLGGQAEPLAQLCDYLRDKRMLLYFDNFEHLLLGAPVLEALLEGATQMQVLVSSREPLHLPTEHVYPLDPLPVNGVPWSAVAPALAPAVQLFADRARAVDPLFFVTEENLGEITEICAGLQGVPLAIELVAAWCGTRDLQELRRELREQLDIAARAPDVPERHRSVRASCDWSYSLLSEEQRLALRCIAVFRGGFTLDAAQSVIPLPRLAAVLQELIDKSWLYHRSIDGEHRYLVHDAAIGEYAYQRLLKSDDFEIVVGAHSQYYSALCSTLCDRLHSQGQLEAVKGLSREFENILQALETALHRADTASLERFAARLGTYLILVGDARSCRGLYEAMLEELRELHSREGELAAQLGLAEALLQLGEYQAARMACEASLAFAPAGAADPVHARAHALLGEIERLEGRHGPAHEQCQRALDLARACDDRHTEARALHELARIDVATSSYAEARGLCGQALEIRRDLGDLHGTAACLNDIGNTYYREGRYREAGSMHHEGLAIQRLLGDRRGIALSLSNLGNVEFFECNYGEAWELYTESLALRRDIGERFGIAASLNNLGNVEYCAGNYLDARKLHEEGLAIKRAIGDRIGISISLNNLGNISIKLGEYGRAAAELAEALSISLELHSKECMLAPLAISAALFAILERYHIAAILYWGVAKQLGETGIALDPMDGGMHEEAGRRVREELAPEALGKHREIAAQMALEDFVRLVLNEMAALKFPSDDQEVGAGAI